MTINAVGRILFLSALACAAATPAHGQFGALRRAAAGAAARAAGAPAATPATPSNGRPPSFDHETLEITAAVAGRFQAALDAERAERTRLGADRAALGQAQVRIETYERCERRERERLEAADASVDQGQQAQLAARMTQAVMRGDTGTYRRMVDSITNARANQVSQASAACGARPNDAYAVQTRVQNAEQRVADAAAEAGGFTTRQYAILRERIAPFVLAGGNLPGAERVYTAVELEALRGALPGYMGHATELRT